MSPRLNRLLLHATACVALICALTALVGVVAVWRASRPPQLADQGVAITTLGLDVESLAFTATDGVPLDGWLLRGARGAPAVLMAHDFGQTRVTLVNLARLLHEAGFTVLLFDFRGHGASGGGGSTFGVAEKRDLLGALEALGRATGSGDAPVGVYGTGMGAYAAVLAAADRPALRVLVLDGLYPDAGWPLTRRVWGSWQPGPTVQRVPLGLFTVINRLSPTTPTAAEVLHDLHERELLLLAPSSNPELSAAIRAMYDSIPERRDLERGFTVLPAVRDGGRYGADHERHARTVVEFFGSRLRRR